MNSSAFSCPERSVVTHPFGNGVSWSEKSVASPTLLLTCKSVKTTRPHASGAGSVSFCATGVPIVK